MDTVKLAHRARDLRKDLDISQAEVARRLVAAGYAEKLSSQAISQAENDSVGANMNALRVAIIEELAGQKVEGPYWFVQGEVAR